MTFGALVTDLPYMTASLPIVVREVLDGAGQAGAVFSTDERHRYLLWRVWDDRRPYALFVGLNPSTATHLVSDPTCTREVERARAMGFGGYVKANLFGLRATDPKELYRARRAGEPIGADRVNDDVIAAAAEHAGMVVCCWGVHGALDQRGEHVASMLVDRGHALHCFVLTKDGHPGHPLYLPYDQGLRGWRYPAIRQYTGSTIAVGDVAEPLRGVPLDNPSIDQGYVDRLRRLR